MTATARASARYHLDDISASVLLSQGRSSRRSGAAVPRAICVEAAYKPPSKHDVENGHAESKGRNEDQVDQVHQGATRRLARDEFPSRIKTYAPMEDEMHTLLMVSYLRQGKGSGSSNKE